MVLLCPIIAFSQKQGEYQKVRVSLKSKDFSELMKTGVDYDHSKPLPGRYVDLELSQEELSILKYNGWSYDVLVADLEAYYSDQNRPSELENLHNRGAGCNVQDCNTFSNMKTPLNYKAGSMGGFHTYTEMLNVLDQMRAKYPHLISLAKPISTIKTLEGRDILYVRVSNNPEFKQNKPEVLYTALHHAREPNSLSQMIFYLWHLLENYDRDSEVTNIINNTELYFIPCVNPDGYIANNTSHPAGGGMWRKNRRKNDKNEAVGVDLNRNYGFNWGADNEGSSPNPNAETYRGKEAFSEPETQAIADFISGHQFLLNLNYHTHGNYLIYPWGYTSDPNPHQERFRSVGGLLTYENCFISGKGEETVGYRTNGDSDDWMYGEVTTKNRVFSFTPEIGGSFYPVAGDIDMLNKSVMDMNLKLPKLARNYSEASPVNLPIGLSNETKSISFVVNKYGFRNEPVWLSLSIDKGTIQSTGSRQVDLQLNLQSGDTDTLTFKFNLNNDLLDGEEVTFTYTLSYDEFSETKKEVLQYFRSKETPIFQDNFETNFNWVTTGTWTRTNILKVDGTYSLTDSPTSLYKSGTTTYATVPQAFDLSKAHKAKILYNARWAIEEDFDYAQIQASTDGINFSPLCGNHTRINNINQVVYDGFQTSWIEEEIDLSDFVGNKTVFIRFVLSADDLNDFDGIYIDNFRVRVIEKFTTSSNDLDNTDIRLYPNPVSEVLQVEGAQDAHFTIFNALGQEVKRGALINSGINVESLQKGLYHIRLSDKKTGITTSSFSKL